jgi:hypothetical protein
MKKFILLAFSFLFVLSCTSDFDEINERPDALTAADVSAKFFCYWCSAKILCSK